jgi:hypothetical protein
VTQEYKETSIKGFGLGECEPNRHDLRSVYVCICMYVCVMYVCMYVCSVYVCMLSVMQCYFNCLNFFGLVLILLYKCIFMTLKCHGFSLDKTTPRIDFHL